MSSVSRTAGGSAPPSADAGAPADSGVDLQSVKAVGKTFVSRGHFAGQWTAEIAVNEAALSTYTHLAPSSRFPVGAMLVKKHASLSASKPGPTFVMTKRDAGFYPQGGDWEYTVLDAEGHLEDRGKLPLCARCHAEANGDWVFGLPAEAR
jgi:hypothetical protein